MSAEELTQKQKESLMGGECGCACSAICDYPCQVLNVDMEQGTYYEGENVIHQVMSNALINDHTHDTGPIIVDPNLPMGF